MRRDDEAEADPPSAAPSIPSTEELLELSGEDSLDQIRELVLRDRSLTDIGTLLEPLCALEVLSMSNNRLRSIAACSSLANLCVLNVNFNRLSSLEPLAACTSLTRLYASTNKVGSVAPLSRCSQLRAVSLFRNCIASLDAAIATLRELPALEELVRHALPVPNPVPPCRCGRHCWSGAHGHAVVSV